MDKFGSRNCRDHITSRLRLRDFDYTSPGYYFVTVCCENRAPFFGEVRDKQMALNQAGSMVHTMWQDLPESFRAITVDSLVTMPNHVHALIGIGVNVFDPEDRSSLVDVLHWFKSLTTNRYIKGVREHGWQPFDGRLWQARFHDHIVRNDHELEVIRNYIVTNPERWDEDTYFD